jgi:hypothetical protein
VRRQVAREHLPVVVERRVAGEHEHVAGAADFVARVLLADAALGGDQVGDRLGARTDDLGGAPADLVALVARERRLVGPGDREGPPDLLDACLRHRADHGPRVGVVDLDHAAAAHAFATDAHLLVERVAGADPGEVGDRVHRRVIRGG